MTLFNYPIADTLPPFDSGSTARTSRSCIDEITRHATCTTQWFLENDAVAGTHPITAENLIRLLVCGEEGFGALAADLEQARSSVDIACWAFDPAMELVREAGDHWPRGRTLGELLRSLATRADRPVKLRLMAWYSHIASRMQQNLPGYKRWQAPGQGRPDEYLVTLQLNKLGHTSDTVAARRARHCIEWWRWALNPANKHLVEVRLRSGDSQAVKDAAVLNPLWSELDFMEQKLLKTWPTHHQKTVLVDYHHLEGAKAVGYVMGFNSLTGYWDTRRHVFNDARRERAADAPPQSIERETAKRVARAGGDIGDVRLDPLHDYACRIAGQALQSVHANFRTAWIALGGDCEARVPTGLAEATRYAQGSRLQVVRTQPTEKDQTVRDLYFHVTERARTYIYIENQYFQLTQWAEHLTEARRRNRALYQKVAPSAGPGDPNTLHVFIVIPRPEIPEMVPRTFDTLERLASSELMHEVNIDGQDVGKYHDVQRARDARRENESEMGEGTFADRQRTEAQTRRRLDEIREVASRERPTAEQLEAIGLRVLVAMPESFDDGSSGLVGKSFADRYRQIYIHSKLMIVDDAFFTVGSANLNVRSMCADTEINIASDDPEKTRDFRKDVWDLYTGGTADGGCGSRAEIKKTFGYWKVLLTDNDLAKSIGQPLTGFLCTFHDSQTSNLRFA